MGKNATRTETVGPAVTEAAQPEVLAVASVAAPSAPSALSGLSGLSAPTAGEASRPAGDRNPAQGGAGQLPALYAEPVPAMQLPRVRRAPGVAFAAAPESVSRPQSGSGTLSLEALNRKQEELARKEQDLKNLQAELDSRFAQMQELETRLQIMLRDAEEMKDGRYRHLVDVLSNMKARQAADVLATLDEKIAVRVLAGMRGRQAGEILSFADPVKAARLTEQLARIQMPLE